MDNDKIPHFLPYLNQILGDEGYWIAFNDRMIMDYCKGANGRIKHQINLADDNLPVGLCMCARNVSVLVREKCIMGEYQGQYDDLIHKWEKMMEKSK
jgi:hypothetical protein